MSMEVGTSKLLSSESPPSLLYHYTSLAGLQGILKSGEIWASHSQFMNDRDETSKGYEVMRDHAVERMNSVPNIDEPTLSAILDGSLSDSMTLDTLFISCFSKRGDELSLWRGYGSDSGYSIAFRTDKLLNVGRRGGREDMRHNPYLLEVLYSDGVYLDLFRKLYEQANPGPGLSPLDMNVLRAGLKHRAWSDELEWRLVAAHHTDCGSDDSSELGFHDGPYGLTPHIAFTLWGNDGNALDWIESITVGPGNFVPERVEGIEYFLRSRNLFHGGVPVRPTVITMRP